MLLNLTNHSSHYWSQTQLQAAQQRWESVQDYPFPSVPPDADTDWLFAMAKQVLREVQDLQPSAVLCQGEMRLCFLLVTLLQGEQIPVVTATTIRNSVEYQREDGTSEKNTIFSFVQFCEYPNLINGT